MYKSIYRTEAAPTRKDTLLKKSSVRLIDLLYIQLNIVKLYQNVEVQVTSRLIKYKSIELHLNCQNRTLLYIYTVKAAYIDMVV